MRENISQELLHTSCNNLLCKYLTERDVLSHSVTTKKKGQRISQLERDRRLILLAMRKKITHSKKTGKPIQQASEQLITYPLALCKDGKPVKGTKSYTTQSLEARYKKNECFYSSKFNKDRLLFARGDVHDQHCTAWYS